jgi:hypothetical protein
VSIDLALELTAFLVGIGTALGSFELMALTFGWKSLTSGPQIMRYALVGHTSILRLVLPIQFAASLFLASRPAGPLLVGVCLILTTGWITIISVTFAGIEASDYVNLAITSCLGIAACSFRLMAVVLITVIASLVYFVAGISKLTSTFWGLGHAMLRIFDRGTYGWPPLYRFSMKNLGLVARFERLITVGEILFPAIIFAPAWLAVALLGAWFLFHVGTAVVMGLNLFTFSFVAMFPSVLAVNSLVHRT